MNNLKILEENNIPYIIKKGNYKRITIGYYHKGYLTIKCPVNMPLLKLETFINSNIKWIINHKPDDFFKEHQYMDDEDYLFLGKSYKMKIFENKHSSVDIINDNMIIYTAKKDSLTIKKIINSWRMNQAALVFQEVLNKCFREMSNYLNEYPIIEIKRYKSRWGCCFPKYNKIVINVSVVNLPIHLIEYVIYHELAHFVYLNHSVDYHHFLQKFVPNERQLKKELIKYNSLYE